MSDLSPSAFQSLYDQWQSATQSIECADAEVLDALREVRQKGDERATLKLETTVRNRRHAQDRLRALMQQLWAHPI